ncbi:MAG: 4-(cytidine 5'-diphospho)-2-C-methyl-D-erythritol kinase [Planctomycetota bacterium]|jgi:4-diphosphocytidyl-2-C-methyl-D-erythritol kinase
MEQVPQFESTEKSLLVRAPAKINLSLLITGKRDDGFHGIETLMAKIDWHDELLFEQGSGDGIELICTGSHWAPDGEENLVWRACQMLMDRAGQQVPIRVTLTKNIPAGTGLGSASSDAAAAVMGLNRFANLNQPNAVLHEICAALGSDINFFLGGPLAYCTGRGEKIAEIDTKFEFSGLLLTPDISVSTKSVYKHYLHSPERYNGLAAKINPLLAKKKVDSIAKMCANMLESGCFSLNKELRTLKNACETLCGQHVCLSGSGSAMYVLTSDLGDRLRQLQRMLKTDFNCESRVINNNRW